MRIADAQWIPATQHQTWDALTDPEVLQKCIPGCVEVTRKSPTEYAVTLRAKLAGIDGSRRGCERLHDCRDRREWQVKFPRQPVARTQRYDAKIHPRIE